MRVNRASRATLLLTELMASVLLFALAGAVCVRILARAGELSGEARALNRGYLAVSTAADLLRDGGAEGLSRAYPQTRVGERTEIPLEEGCLRLTFRQENSLTVCYIEWYEDETPVYSQEIVLPPEEAAP